MGVPPQGAQKDDEAAQTDIPDTTKEAVVNSSSGEAKNEDGKEGEYDAQPTQKAELKNYLRILSYGGSIDYALMGAGVATSIAAGVTLPLMNIVFGRLVGNFTAYFVPHSSVTRAEFMKIVEKNTLIIVYLFIARFACDYVAMFAFRITGIRISAAIRLAYLRALFGQSISYMDTLPAGTVTSRITNSANTVQLGISEKLVALIQGIALFFGAYVIAFIYSWKMTLVASSILPFVAIVYSITIPIQVKFTRSIEFAEEKASSLAGEIFGSIRTVVAFGGESRLGSKYDGWVTEARRRGLKVAPLIGAQFSPLFFGVYANFGLSFWYGVRLYSTGEIPSISVVITVFFSVLMAVMTMSMVVAPITAMVKATSASSELFATIDAPAPNTTGLKDPDASAHEDITFKGVNFAYPSRPDVQVLEELNLSFEAGKITAIVGPSGSGKSTIVGLLERWYDIRPESFLNKEPNELSETKESDTEHSRGSIKVGNHGIYDLDLKWWRSQIGLVQQEPFLFNDTIFQNVAYSLVGSRWENEDEPTKLALVKEACSEAFADEFIDKLPQGYDTKVGESGIKLSGGQRQRIAIARSIVKRPDLLILDEATSSIDVRSERIVQEALDRVSKNRTTIVIAHRLSTIKKADKIVVLSKGKVVQEGTHEGLLEDVDGVYYKLVNAQALSMEDENSKSGEDVGSATSSDIHPTYTNKSERSRRGSTLAGDGVGDPEYKQKGIARSFGLILYEQRKYWILFLLTLIGTMGSGAAYSLQAYIFANITMVFTYTGKKLIHGGNFWSLMFFIEAICVGIFYIALGWSSHSTSVYFDGIIRKRIVFFDGEENSSGTLVSRLSTDPTQLQELMGINMAMAFIAAFNVMGSVAISFAFGWKLTLVGLFAATPLIFVAGFMRIRFEIQFEKLNAKVYADSSQFATEAISAFRTVTSLTLEDVICDRYAALLTDQQKKALHTAKFATFIFALSDSIELLCTALIYWYGGRLLSTHEYNIVQFFTIFIAMVYGGQAAGMWCSFAPNMAQASASANRILSLRPGRLEVERPSGAKLGKGEGGVEIEFKNVHFKYPTRDVTVFSGLDMKIEKGQFAALVGPSGCGKTTIISLLERFYDPDKGTITFDGKNITDLDIADYRNAMSLVSQEPTLYQGTIKENILLAIPPSASAPDDNDDALHRACKDAEIHDFITSLPEAYATPVGQHGTSLSGGQKQRIAIARALIRDPRVLLLDEATSSLDSESERLVQRAFERAAKKEGGGGRTVVVVAHRLATIQNADVIFVFGEGGILEKGNHKSLLAKRGIYFQMCQSQALDR
ncbi:hypothetical protein FGG08_002392 [Glutinoglossum americanum]|uniref:Uncharacterized protein n=1 Tax=Glutinoglossum americanum TaxID=1670608 RepID=A0A9P8L1P0_9PEZI|nr:hypothetical protein FGG08_002392 [Glutinoglossum americanum]